MGTKERVLGPSKVPFTYSSTQQVYADTMPGVQRNLVRSTLRTRSRGMKGV